MLRSLYKGISTLSQVALNVPDPCIDNVPEFVPDSSNIRAVLDEIFSIDERSGLPKGDIQYYLSKDGNPVVKQWIESNLLKPRMFSSGSSVEGVTDDLINEMSKRTDESFESYASRLHSILQEGIENSENS